MGDDEASTSGSLEQAGGWAAYLEAKKLESPEFAEKFDFHVRRAAIYLPLSFAGGAGLPFVMPWEVRDRRLRLLLSGMTGLTGLLLASHFRLSAFLDDVQDLEIEESQKLREAVIALKYNEYLRDGGDPDQFDPSQQ